MQLLFLSFVNCLCDLLYNFVNGLLNKGNEVTRGLNLWM